MADTIRSTPKLGSESPQYKLKIKKVKIFYEKLNKFTLDDFTKGLRIFGLYIKLINYQRYSLLVNKFQ